MSEQQAQEDQVTSLSSDSFLEACREGFLSRTDAIAFTNDQDPSTRSMGLNIAAENGHFNAVRYLLEVEPAIEVDPRTADHAARGGLLVYRLLHSKYPDMTRWNFGDPSGSAVHTAVRCGDIELLTYVLENGGDPGRTADCPRHAYIFTPLDDCALVDNEEAARVLVKYGATFKATEALEIAVSFGHLELARFFIELGADVNDVRGIDDPYWRPGCTSRPLHKAAQSGQLDMVQLLLAHGADPQLQNESGMTAIDVAKGAERPDILGLLEEKFKGGR